MAEANELITWLGVKLKPDAKSNIDKVNAGIDTLKAGVGKLNKFFFGAGGAIEYFKDSIMGGSQEMLNLSKKTGVSIQKLQQWKYAAQASGQSFQGLTGDLENFRKLGVDAISLSGRLAGMGERQALQLKDKFGLSDDMFNILRQGPKAVQGLLNSAPVMSEEKIKQAAEAHRQLHETLAKIDILKNEVMMELAPIILEALKAVNEFVTQNGEWIKSNIKPIVYGLLALFAGGKLFSALMAIKTVLVGIANIIPALTKVATKTAVAANGATAATGAKAAIGIGAKAAGVGSIAMGWDFASSAIKGEKNFVENLTESTLEKSGVERGGFRNYLEKKWAEGSFTGIAKMFGFTEAEIERDRLQYKRKYGLAPLSENIQQRRSLFESGDQSITNHKSISQNSNNVINIQMPYEQAVDFVKDITGGENAIMASIPGAFGPNT